jgi:hypothetical protein
MPALVSAWPTSSGRGLPTRTQRPSLTGIWNIQPSARIGPATSLGVHYHPPDNRKKARRAKLDGPFSDRHDAQRVRDPDRKAERCGVAVPDTQFIRHGPIMALAIGTSVRQRVRSRDDATER